MCVYWFLPFLPTVSAGSLGTLGLLEAKSQKTNSAMRKDRTLPRDLKKELVDEGIRWKMTDSLCCMTLSPCIFLLNH